MDEPLAYLNRIREYYLALGYKAPYRWASFDDVPFCPLSKPVNEASIAIITTAALYQPGKGDQGPGAPYNGAAKFFTVYSRSTQSECWNCPEVGQYRRLVHSFVAPVVCFFGWG